VSEVMWINGAASPHLAIVLRPHGGVWLEDELRRIGQGGIQTIVSLLEPFEAELLDLGDEANAATSAGLQFLSFPIPDTQVPSDAAQFRRFIDGIAQRLASGERIGVHCRGSIGRATVTAACALIQLGWKPRTALEAIAQARGMQVPDTQEQEDWILRYRAEP